MFITLETEVPIYRLCKHFSLIKSQVTATEFLLMCIIIHYCYFYYNYYYQMDLFCCKAKSRFCIKDSINEVTIIMLLCY